MVKLKIRCVVFLPLCKLTTSVAVLKLLPHGRSFGKRSSRDRSQLKLILGV
uniref:Neuropeptide 9 n=1 Tax=Stichopus japonicus TaxID=307972 RepID=A0A4D6JEM7_STIJA|nr:neuropeptide precursor 9 [Apostichopus japonicus]